MATPLLRLLRASSFVAALSGFQCFFTYYEKISFLQLLQGKLEIDGLHLVCSI